MFEEAFFQRKSCNLQKLEAFGFQPEGGGYIYATPILDGQFRLIVTLPAGGGVTTQVYDNETGDEYVLYKVGEASGAFTGGVRAAVEAVLAEVSRECFEPDVFRSEQARQAIAYIRQAYGSEPEYLWEKFPDNAVWRRADNRKWFGAILTVAPEKLGLPPGEPTEIIDLRIAKGQVEHTVDGKKYFPGWHMNKKSWYTMLLDGSVAAEEVFRRIDESYRLAAGK